MIFSFCFSKNQIQIVFFQMIYYFEHYFNIYISTSMDQILWNAPVPFKDSRKNSAWKKAKFFSQIAVQYEILEVLVMV